MPTAAELGKNTRLSFGSGADPEVFNNLAGEKSFDVTQASTDVDTTDKDGPAGQYVPGRLNFSVSGNVKLPSPALDRVDGASQSGEVINMKATTLNNVVRFLGTVTVGNFKRTYATDGTVAYSFDATAAATPTTNSFNATA